MIRSIQATFATSEAKGITCDISCALSFVVAFLFKGEKRLKHPHFAVMRNVACTPNVQSNLFTPIFDAQATGCGQKEPSVG